MHVSVRGGGEEVVTSFKAGVSNRGFSLAGPAGKAVILSLLHMKKKRNDQKRASVGKKGGS